MKKMRLYPDPLCMICGKWCDIVETHNLERDDEEIWCYCKKCKIDTFYEPLTDEDIKNLEKDAE